MKTPHVYIESEEERLTNKQRKCTHKNVTRTTIDQFHWNDKCIVCNKILGSEHTQGTILIFHDLST